MVRNILCAGAMLVVTCAIVLADAAGTLVSIEGNKITINQKADKNDKKGQNKTYEAAENVKAVKMEGKNKSEVPGGLKADGLKAKAKVNLVESNGKVTEVQFFVPKKK